MDLISKKEKRKLKKLTTVNLYLHNQFDGKQTRKNNVAVWQITAIST
jgi:hypothetical protein